MVSEKELIELVVRKKEFSQLLKKDVETAFRKFDREKYSDEEKVKLTRDLLRKTFSGFAGKNLLNWKNKDAEDILKKHLSTRERFEYYDEIYSRILKRLPEKISIIDLGSGTNGFSYSFLKNTGKNANYLGVEAVGQLVDMTNNYFKSLKIKKFKAVQESLFEIEKIKKLISEMKEPRVIFMFKVIDSLEVLERDYTKKLLQEIMPLVDRCVLSFATESWLKRRKFLVQRTWIINFIRENWEFVDDFTLGGERYLVFE